MAKDEVEIGENETEDYEVVPVGPIRKLERRIDDIEQKAQGSGDDEFVRDVLDIMKSNQKIVNEMTESTHELRNSVEDLTHKMDEVVDNMNSFMDLLNEASETDLEGEVIQDVHKRIADAVGDKFEDVARDIQESNREVVQHLENLNDNIEKSRRTQMSQNESSRSPGLNINRENADGRKRENSGRGRQQSGNREDMNRGNPSSGGNERMRKLREKFDDVGQE